MTKKHIGTLRNDIYDALSNPDKYDWSDTKENLSKSFAAIIINRLAERKDKAGLSLSQSGEKCHRKIWLKDRFPKDVEKPRPEVFLKFLYGDLIEALILELARVSGHEVKGQQDTVFLEGVPGHRDAIIDGVLVDCKSANSRGFDKFKNHLLAVPGNDSFGYLAQINAYLQASMDATEKGFSAFLAVDKELGHIVLDAYPAKDMGLKEELKAKKETLSKDELPKRFYSDEEDGKSGNRKLCLQCSYCDVKKVCWKDSNNGNGLRTFLYSNGPRYLTKVEKLPDVDEVKD